MAPAITEREGGFVFETEEMSGRIEPAGAYHGVWQLRDKQSGKELIHPQYSALNLFRLFAVHQGMGQPRVTERSVVFDRESVTVRWGATEAHQGELEARYAIAGPATIDLDLTARIHGTYAGYELFLSSYFDPVLKPFVYLKTNRYGKATEGYDRVCPTVNDVFRGTVLVFARDAHASRRCIDGRWDRSEWGAPTVQMCPVRHYAFPVACLEDVESTRAVLLMAGREDCVSISTRYYAEKEADRMTPYSAFDLSLFGRDVVPEQEIHARVRMVLVTLDGKEDVPLKAYEGFQKEIRK